MFALERPPSVTTSWWPEAVAGPEVPRRGLVVPVAGRSAETGVVSWPGLEGTRTAALAVVNRASEAAQAQPEAGEVVGGLAAQAPVDSLAVAVAAVECHLLGPR